METFELRYRDTDPDTGEIVGDNLLCICYNELKAEWIFSVIAREISLNFDEPNREFYIKKVD